MACGTPTSGFEEDQLLGLPYVGHFDLLTAEEVLNSQVWCSSLRHLIPRPGCKLCGPWFSGCYCITMKLGGTFHVEPWNSNPES